MSRWVNRRTTRHRPRNADDPNQGGDDSRGHQHRDTKELEDLAGSVDFKDADMEAGEVPLNELDNFFVPGRDEKGASQAITIHVPPYLARCLNVLVHSKRFPYVSLEELVRHAAVRHAFWLNAIRVTIQPQMMPMLDMVLEANKDAEFRIKAESAMRLIDGKIDYYMRANEVGEAVKLIGFIMHRVREVEGSAKQREFMRLCMMKYAPVMAGVKGWEEAFEIEEARLNEAEEGGKK